MIFPALYQLKIQNTLWVLFENAFPTERSAKGERGSMGAPTKCFSPVGDGTSSLLPGGGKGSPQEYQIKKAEHNQGMSVCNCFTLVSN